MNIQQLPTLLAALLLTVGLTACTTAEGEEVGSTSTTVTIQPVGNEMKFAQAELTARAGEQVTFVFENTATSAAMQHNVVFLEGTSDAVIKRVGEAALQAGPSKEYVPEDDAIFAYTPLAAPGETVEVTFTAPSEPGTYSYICTFPGHYMVMRGTLTVVA